MDDNTTLPTAVAVAPPPKRFNVYKVQPFDLWNYLFTQVHSPQLIRWQGAFADHLDLAALGQAIEASYKAMPLITARFLSNGLWPRWRPRPVALEEVLHVVDRPADPVAAIRDAMAVTLDFAGGPQLRVTVVRQDDHDTICVVVNHMLCDGTGFRDYLIELSRLYTQTEAGETPTPRPPLPRGVGPVVARFSRLEHLTLLRGRAEAFSREAIDAAGAVSFERPDGPDRYLTRLVPEPVFTKARQAAKAHGATVNDLALASLSRAWCHLTGVERMALPSTFDLRSFLPPGEQAALAHLATNCLIAVTVPPDAPMAHTLTQVHDQMTVHKSGASVLRSALAWPLATTTCPWPILKRNYGRFLTLPGVSFSNLGVIDPKEVSFANHVMTAAHFSTAVKPVPFMQLVISSLRGDLTLSFNLRGDDEAVAFAERMFDAIAGEMADFGASHAPAAETA
ncbi:MAG: hypothetical protein LBH76_05810 [Propionibacteriaceae bacterium]|jgi:NRPS condensation-like uncharacterized protein|nr:hypothetical protein [Propionibacteriaceae bacterium]